MDVLHKRGQGLPLSTIVLLIIVVVVLILIVAFFLGGATGITSTIKNVFFGATAGTDMTLALENCRQYCEQAKTFETGPQKSESPYCKRFEHIDVDGDGEADIQGENENEVIYYEYYCFPFSGGKPNHKSLEVPCPGLFEPPEKCAIPQ
jgi:hypothetical protein